MDYDYYNHDYYYYDDYHGYDGWEGEYGGDNYGYDDSYWDESYWYDEESPEYYSQNYDESQDYGEGYHGYADGGEYYGNHSGGYQEDGYNQGYSRSANDDYTEGTTHTQSDQQQQHHYYGSNSWSTSTITHSHSHAVDHHSLNAATLALPVSSTPPLPPTSSVPPNISVLPLLRTGTPLLPPDMTAASRALEINRNQSLSVKPIDSQSAKSALTPTPTESFFHNLFWRSPDRRRARTRPTTPVAAPDSRQRAPSPNFAVNNVNRSPAARISPPIAGYDAARGTDIGFLAPALERT